jgi:Ca-activated chloride channel homolog
MKFLFFAPNIVWAVLGGAAALITLLYILKLRRRRVEVPFAALWRRVLVEKQTSALWRKLRRLLSLLIALAVVALLALAAGDPRQVLQGEDGRTMVILLDASASMRATDAVGAKSRLEAAKAEAKKIVGDLGRNDYAMVARFDSQVVPLSPFSQDDRLLAAAVEGVEAADTRGDVLRALSFAADALRGRPNPSVVVVSDGAFGPKILSADLPALGGAKLHFIGVGQGKRNVGISAFNARRLLSDRLSYQLYLEVKNYGEAAEEVDLTLYLGDRPFDAQRVLIQPGATLSRFYTPEAIGVDAEQSHLTARLGFTGPGDDFPADDVAYALIPKRQRVRVLIASSVDDFFLEGAFYSEGDTLDVERRPCAEATAEAAAGFTAVVFDRCAPAWAKAAAGNFFYIDPPDEGSPFVRAKAEAPLPKITRSSKKHPLLRWVTFVDLTIAAARPFVGVSGEAAIAEIREGALIAARRDGERRVVAWGFDLAKTDLPLRVAFPVLIQNVLAYFTDDDATYIANYRTGETWYVPVKADAEEAEVLEPGGAKRAVPVYDHRAIFSGRVAGFYEVAAGAERFEVAANLADEVESNIAPPTEPPLPGAELGAPAGGGAVVKREVWVSLVLLAVAILLIEWLTYHRRLTV